MISVVKQQLKKNPYPSIVPFALKVTDLAIFLIILAFLKRFLPLEGMGVQNYFLLSVSMSLGWIIAGVLSGSYQIENMDRVRKILIRSTNAFVIFLVLIFGLWSLGNISVVGVQELMILSVVPVASILIVRMFMHRLYCIFINAPHRRKNAIIVGNTPRGKELSRFFLFNAPPPQKYLGYFDDSAPAKLEDIPYYLGKLEDVKKYCQENRVNEIYYALDQQRNFFADLMKFADEHFIFFGIVPDVDGMDFSRKVDTLVYNDSKIPVISSRKIPLHLIVNWYVKRAFDIIFSSVVLFFLSISVFPVIALAIKISSPGPVFFKQLRPGVNNRLFWCYKFRTMKVNNEGHKQASKNDSRITKVGAFLRKTSLDELPQFLNVLKGDMSVVGPRPNLVVHLEEYPKEIKEYPLRHWVVPGITGFAQVSGYRGETKETILMQKRVEHDLMYIENWSLSLDLKIIWKTVVNMIKGEEQAY